VKRLVVALALLGALSGCAMLGEPVSPIAVPSSLSDAGKQAAQLVNEGNVLIAALANTLRDDVQAGVYTREQGQRYLDRLVEAADGIDKANDLLRMGQYDEASSVAKLQQSLLTALQRELAAQARKGK